MYKWSDIMLKKFEVEGFKGFHKKLEFDLESHNNYQFNTKLIENGIIKNAIIYGKNASGKTNVGLAIFDLIFHLTDKNKNMESRYNNYLNLDSDNNYATFTYIFELSGGTLKYTYRKESLYKLIYEEVEYNNEKILSYDFTNPSKKIINIEEAKTLNWKYNNDNISIVKYIVNNTKLSSENPLNKLMKFVNGMLWFRSMEGNSFIGLKNNSDSLNNIVINNNKLVDFEKFLKSNGLNYQLYEHSDQNGKRIGVKFENGTAWLDEIVSTGTRSLWLFYCWKVYFSDIKFLFIDEFDSNYHYALSIEIIKILNSTTKIQSMVTSHNTALMSNKITRPDCTFIINDSGINSLPKCTDKELREAHNIEKLYREGLFTD